MEKSLNFIPNFQYEPWYKEQSRLGFGIINTKLTFLNKILSFYSNSTVSSSVEKLQMWREISRISIAICSACWSQVDFCKVLRTISSASSQGPRRQLCDGGGDKTLSYYPRPPLVRGPGLCLRRSVYSVYFWGFCPFQFFIVPIYRAITKNISESTCGKSGSQVKYIWNVLRVISYCYCSYE